MRRQDKYPETATFHYFNANPHNKITGDCWVRAESVALDIPYEQIIKENAELMIKTGYACNDTKGIASYLAKKGIVKMPQPKKLDGTKYTIKDFCLYIAEPGKRYLVTMANHMVAIVDRKAWDIWDCTKYTKCVGNYWCIN